MCGRYTLATPPDDLVEAFDLPGLTFDYFARFNIAPGTAAPVVAEDRRGRRIGLLQWGFAPSWRDDPGSGHINARAETVTTKTSFREAFARRRCLLPADGFYEWRREDGAKIPYWIHPSDGHLISFAGIWESWVRPGVEPRHTFAILTTEANADVRPIHERMPVVVPPADRTTWLDRSSDARSVTALLRPALNGTLTSHVVDARVNRTDADDSGLVEPVES